MWMISDLKNIWTWYRDANTYFHMKWHKLRHLISDKQTKGQKSNELSGLSGYTHTWAKYVLIWFRHTQEYVCEFVLSDETTVLHSFQAQCLQSVSTVKSLSLSLSLYIFFFSHPMSFHFSVSLFLALSFSNLTFPSL